LAIPLFLSLRGANRTGISHPIGQRSNLNNQPQTDHRSSTRTSVDTDNTLSQRIPSRYCLLPITVLISCSSPASFQGINNYFTDHNSWRLTALCRCRPYRTFLMGACFIPRVKPGATIKSPRRGAFSLASPEKGTLKLPSPFQGFPSLERFCKHGIYSFPNINLSLYCLRLRFMECMMRIA